jgi:hypothetical protein
MSPIGREQRKPRHAVSMILAIFTNTFFASYLSSRHFEPLRLHIAAMALGIIVAMAGYAATATIVEREISPGTWTVYERIGIVLFAIVMAAAAIEQLMTPSNDTSLSWGMVFTSAFVWTVTVYFGSSIGGVLNIGLAVMTIAAYFYTDNLIYLGCAALSALLSWPLFQYGILEVASQI